MKCFWIHINLPRQNINITIRILTISTYSKQALKTLTKQEALSALCNADTEDTARTYNDEVNARNVPETQCTVIDILTYIFTSHYYQPPSNDLRILTSHQHPCQPIQRCIVITAPHGFLQSRQHMVMLITCTCT